MYLLLRHLFHYIDPDNMIIVVITDVNNIKKINNGKI